MCFSVENVSFSVGMVRDGINCKIHTFKPAIVIEGVAADSVSCYFPQGMQLITNSCQCIDLRVMYVMMMVVI